MGTTRHATRHRSLTLCCIAVLAVSACGGGNSNDEASAPPADLPATASCTNVATGNPYEGTGGLPRLELPCLAIGPVVALQTLSGRPTLVNLWASWCAPCLEEMPLLQEAFEEHGASIGFLGVVIRDEASIAADYAATTGVTYPHVVDVDGALLEDLGLMGLPVTLAIDRAGRVIATESDRCRLQTCRP